MTLFTAPAAADTPAEFEFRDGDLVTGEFVRLHSCEPTHRPRTGGGGLIRLRTSFVAELLDDTEAL